jgi:hypothetical protein
MMQYTITKINNAFETMIRYQDGRENNSFATLEEAEKAVIDGALVWNHDDITINDIVYLEEVTTLPAKQVRPSSRENLQIEEKFIVRLFDKYDGWIDITSEITMAEAKKKWNDKTADGKIYTQYSEGSYYEIFPANTRMLITPESLGR